MEEYWFFEKESDKEYKKKILICYGNSLQYSYNKIKMIISNFNIVWGKFFLIAA